MNPLARGHEAQRLPIGVEPDGGLELADRRRDAEQLTVLHDRDLSTSSGAALAASDFSGRTVACRAGMSAGELDESLAWLVSESADALCDMGGDLIAAAAAAGRRPAGALEATTTGLHRLEGLEIPFPVFDWNGIALKDLIHNRHHVGVETWPAFTAITGLACMGVRSSWSGSGRWARASLLVPAISAPS